ncbi:MAG TPA: ATP-binding protein [Spirochaetia bacterium]|nr:ATP-binding protein [Spirochaetia bacterium]
MGELPGLPFPELLVLQAVGQNLLQSDSVAVKRFTLDILNRMDRSILLYDCQGQCLFYNETLTALGQREGQVVPAELDLAGRELNRLLDLGLPVLQFRDELIVAGGRRVPVLLDVYPLPGHQGQRLGSLVLVTDLTEELSTRSWREQMSFVLESVQAGVIVLGPEGKVTVCNRSARLLLELGDDAVEGRPVHNVLAAIADGPQAMLGALIEESGPGTREVEVPWVDGKRYFLVDVSSLPEGSGRVIVFHDQTRFKETEHQVRECEKLAAIGELAAGTAHEIRNPLTTIRGFVQILQQKAKNAGFEDINRYADIIINEIDRVNTIIAEFLLLAKPTVARRQEMDVNQVVDQVFPFVQNEALRLEFSAEKELQEGLPPVVGDVEQIKQVLLNLVNNAFQALSAGGGLKISTFIEDDGRVCLAVEDSGTGIPADIMDKLFKPFFSTKEEGTGLGLAISRRIVEDHGGEITVRSREGAGSTFLIYLPPAN